MNDTLNKMRQMRLLGMARSFLNTMEEGKNEKYTADEMVTQLVEAEWDDRYNRKLERNVLKARFRYKASMEELEYADGRLDRNQIQRLADCSFISKSENVIITGSTGIGKSYLATALGYHACALGYRVAYYHCSKLFGKMKIAKADGSYIKELQRIEKQQLLVLDDFGLQPLDTMARAALMEIIEDRHGKSPTLITSQIPVSKWHEIIGESTVADAILDRLVHDAHRIELKGDSLRRKMKSKQD